MTEAAPGTSAGRGAAPSGTSRRWLPFWILQAIELAVAVVFVDLTVHVHDGGLLVAAAIAFALLALTARGPLGVVKLCGQHLHVVLVVATALAVAVAPVVPAFRPDVQGILVVEFGAFGLVRLATFAVTDQPGSRRGRGPVIDATASVTPKGVRAEMRGTTPNGTGTSEGSEGTGSVRGTAGAGGGGAEPSGDPTVSAARLAGRVAAAASAAGRRATERHGPAVEETVRRTARRAGRFGGKVRAFARKSRGG